MTVADVAELPPSRLGPFRRDPRIPDLAMLAARQPGRYKRVPTYCAPLDRITGGGLQTGRIAIIGGPPGAMKTTWTVAMAWQMASHGAGTGAFHVPTVVAYAATDEPRDGLMSRAGQIGGCARAELEDEDFTVSVPAWDRVGKLFEETPGFLLFDPREDPFNVEEIALLGVEEARKRDARFVLVVDSIQTAPFDCDGSGDLSRDKTARERIDGRMRVLRRLAVEYRVCIIIVSELNRGAYRPGGEANLAAFKESSSIEYGGDVVLTMAAVKGEDFTVQVTPQKNRLGSLEPFRLYRQPDCTFVEAAMPDADEDAQQTAKDAATVARTVADAAAVAALVVARPGLTRRELRAAARGVVGVGAARVEAGLERLGGALVKRDGARRAQHHYLDGDALDGDVLAAVPLADRPRVQAARPPAEEVQGG